MRRILSCPITAADKMDACMGIILSSVPVLTHQSCSVSAIKFPIF